MSIPRGSLYSLDATYMYHLAWYSHVETNPPCLHAPRNFMNLFTMLHNSIPAKLPPHSSAFALNYKNLKLLRWREVPFMNHKNTRVQPNGGSFEIHFSLAAIKTWSRMCMGLMEERYKELCSIADLSFIWQSLSRGICYAAHLC